MVLRTPQCQERPEQSDAGPEALCPVCVDSVLTDDVVNGTGHRRLQVAGDKAPGLCPRRVIPQSDPLLLTALLLIRFRVGQLVGQQAGAAGGAVSAWDT